jgi:hypothetical protein
LETGDIAAEPPVPAPSLAEVAGREVQEGRAPGSAPGGAGLPCAVAFARGQERHVMLRVEGLPPHLLAGAAPDGGLLRRLGPAAAAALAAAAPAAAVVDASPSGAGVVLSAAPLMGAAPSVDAATPRWLHVEVRPQLSALLRVLGGAAAGAELSALGRHLASGHWVLSFPAEGAGARAGMEAIEAAERAMRAAHAQLMAPLLGPPAAAGEDPAAPLRLAPQSQSEPEPEPQAEQEPEPQAALPPPPLPPPQLQEIGGAAPGAEEEPPPAT